MKKRKSKVFIIMFIISISLLNIKIIDQIYYEENNDKQIGMYYEKLKDNNEEDNIDIENEYIGVINIPSIGVEQGFYHTLSSKNKLKSGIKLIKEDMDNILILASHSGRSSIARFNNLTKLKSGDEVKLSFYNRDYTYLYSNSYSVDKTGHVFVKYDITRKTLILITCDLKRNDKQIVYVFYMI